MDSNYMNRLQQFSEKDFYKDADGSKNFFSNLSQLNEKSVTQAVEEERLPKEIHAPTADELQLMAVWMKAYKQANKHASKRQIRKACQVHFNVRIFRKPYKHA